MEENSTWLSCAYLYYLSVRPLPQFCVVKYLFGGPCVQGPFTHMVSFAPHHNLVTSLVHCVTLVHKMRRVRLTKENGPAKGSGQRSQDPNPGQFNPVPSCHPPSHPPLSSGLGWLNSAPGLLTVGGKYATM